MTTPRTTGIAGALARTFIRSKLTPLVIVTAVLLGIQAVVALPREEEPQIIVPMIDVFVDLPGATPTEVEQRVTRPLEQRLWEVPGVEYLYSTSSVGRAMLVVRFTVGEDEDRALVRLQQKLEVARAALPTDASEPRAVVRSIDDVPVMALTLWGSGFDDRQLRLAAGQLKESLAELSDISEITIIGGRARQATVTLDPAALDARGLDAVAVDRALSAADLRQSAGAIVAGGQATRLDAGAWPATVDALDNLVVGSSGGGPVRLADVASVTDDGGEPTDYVAYHPNARESFPAVTLSIAKRKGTNAITLTRNIQRKIATLRGYLLPRALNVSITRDYGATAAQKSDELLWHMLLAILSVSALIWLALGRRESAVVLVAIPVTLALTLFVFYLYGYTLNRITLFALIFSIGILVDDAIVVVENIVRHARMAGDRGHLDAVAIRAVDEVGNPTILATLTVVAAILPMAFVGGLMGPYMRPIPIGATAAMLFSLAVAFIVTPWAAVRLLGRGAAHTDETEDRLTALYRRVMTRFIARPGARWLFLGSVAVLLLAAVALVPTGLVTVKMLPFDNKSELQVMVRLPDDAPLEATARVAGALARQALADPQVVSAQSYAGTSSPYTFNGLVRHYFLRESPSLADLQIAADAKGRPVGAEPRDCEAAAHRRSSPSRRIWAPRFKWSRCRPDRRCCRRWWRRCTARIPPARLALAQQVRSIFRSTAGVVDTDWYVESRRPTWNLAGGFGEGRARPDWRPPTWRRWCAWPTPGTPPASCTIRSRVRTCRSCCGCPRASRSSLDALGALRLQGRHAVAVGELTRLRAGEDEPSLYHKNLQPVTYVTGDVAGAAESPVYAILRMNEPNRRAPPGRAAARSRSSTRASRSTARRTR